MNWLQDVYPEVAVALGVISRRSLFTRTVTWLRNWSLRGATHNVVVGEAMAENLLHRVNGVISQSVIHNWSVTPPANYLPPAVTTLCGNSGT